MFIAHHLKFGDMSVCQKYESLFEEYNMINLKVCILESGAWINGYDFQS